MQSPVECTARVQKVTLKSKIRIYPTSYVDLDGEILSGLERLRWRRYEIESYLLHPAALARFVEHEVGGPDAGRLHVVDLMKHFEDKYPRAFLTHPLGDFPFLNGTKARTELIPPALTAAGLPGLPYTRYHEIAAQRLPEEIHPEVVEKLDAIQRAFNL